MIEWFSERMMERNKEKRKTNRKGEDINKSIFIQTQLRWGNSSVWTVRRTEPAKRISIHWLVGISHWNGLSAGHEFVSDNFAHDVFVKGKVELQIFNVAFVSFDERQRLVQVGIQRWQFVDGTEGRRDIGQGGQYHLYREFHIAYLLSWQWKRQCSTTK